MSDIKDDRRYKVILAERNFIKQLVIDSLYLSQMLPLSRCDPWSNFAAMEAELPLDTVKEIFDLIYTLLIKFSKELDKLFSELEEEDEECVNILTTCPAQVTRGWMRNIFPNYIGALGVNVRNGNYLVEFETFLQKLFDSRNSIEKRANR